MSTTVQTRESMVGDGEHVVQFYDGDADLIRAVGDYLTRAVSEGEAAIVIATEEHRQAFEAELVGGGIDVARAVADGSLVWLDAAQTLATFMREGVVDAARFRAGLSPVVRRAQHGGRPVKAYGEMVALLWDAGDVLGAIEVEKLWNDLGRELASRFGAATTPARWPVTSTPTRCTRSAIFTPRSSTRHGPVPGWTRCALRRPPVRRRACSRCRPYDERAPTEDAKLVVSELATNAVDPRRQSVLGLGPLRRSSRSGSRPRLESDVARDARRRTDRHIRPRPPPREHVGARLGRRAVARRQDRLGRAPAPLVGSAASRAAPRVVTGGCCARTQDPTCGSATRGSEDKAQRRQGPLECRRTCGRVHEPGNRVRCRGWPPPARWGLSRRIRLAGGRKAADTRPQQANTPGDPASRAADSVRILPVASQKPPRPLLCARASSPGTAGPSRGRARPRFRAPAVARGARSEPAHATAHALLRSQLIARIRDEGQVSRSELSRAIGLPRSTTTALVAELLREGVITESPARGGGAGSGSGRPATLLSLRKPDGLVAGFDFGHRHLRVAVATSDGQVLAEESTQLDVDRQADAALDCARELLDGRPRPGRRHDGRGARRGGRHPGAGEQLDGSRRVADDPGQLGRPRPVRGAAPADRPDRHSGQRRRLRRARRDDLRRGQGLHRLHLRQGFQRHRRRTGPERPPVPRIPRHGGRDRSHPDRPHRGVVPVRQPRLPRGDGLDRRGPPPARAARPRPTRAGRTWSIRSLPRSSPSPVARSASSSPTCATRSTPRR